MPRLALLDLLVASRKATYHCNWFVDTIEKSEKEISYVYITSGLEYGAEKGFKLVNDAILPLSVKNFHFNFSVKGPGAKEVKVNLIT